MFVYHLVFLYIGYCFTLVQYIAFRVCLHKEIEEIFALMQSQVINCGLVYLGT